MAATSQSEVEGSEMQGSTLWGRTDGHGEWHSLSTISLHTVILSMWIFKKCRIDGCTFSEGLLELLIIQVPIRDTSYADISNPGWHS